MIVARMVGSIIDKRFLGGQVTQLTERYNKALFVFKLVQALRTEVNGEALKLAEEVADAVRDRVPVDTGELKASVRVVPNKRGARVVEGGTPATMKPIRKGGPAEFDQALGIEYGTTERPAHPHFWPSVRPFEKKIEKSLRDAAERAVSE